jgi:multidrug efflux pump subunit AcrA (membrane-fusion protein)
MSDAPFLPTRPAPWAMRSLATTLMAVFATAVAAAFLIQVPETVESGFVLVSSEQAAPVRAPHSGSVSVVKAHAGDAVTAGHTLLVLRSVALGDRSSEHASLLTQSRADEQSLANERAQWASQQRADEEEERRLAERVQALVRMTALRRESAGVHEEVVTKFEELERQGLTSRTEVLAHRVAWNQATLELRSLESEHAQSRSALETLRHGRQARRLAHEQSERRLTETLDKAHIRIKALATGLGEVRGDELEVKVPCSGVVLRLSADLPGAFVQDGEILGEVSCSDRTLQASLSIPPGEVGRLEAGQGVKLLYEAFPYQRYGVRSGTLAWVGPASVEEPGRTFFPARADITDEAIVVQGRPRPLRAGMGGRAKIVVGRRRLASYAFEPLRQLQESVTDAPGTVR